MDFFMTGQAKCDLLVPGHCLMTCLPVEYWFTDLVLYSSNWACLSRFVTRDKLWSYKSRTTLKWFPIFKIPSVGFSLFEVKYLLLLTIISNQTCTSISIKIQSRLPIIFCTEKPFYYIMQNIILFILFASFNSKTTGVRCGAGTANPSRTPEYTPRFLRGWCCSVFSFLCNILWVVVCTFFILLGSYYWLFFFTLRIQITLSGPHSSFASFGLAWGPMHSLFRQL
jgi:hypothetical protein